MSAMGRMRLVRIRCPHWRWAGPFGVESGCWSFAATRVLAVVIGGGLTGIDTATELFAYYPIQVEKTHERYQALCEDRGVDAVRAMYDGEELTILEEFLIAEHRIHGVLHIFEDLGERDRIELPSGQEFVRL